MKLIEIRDERKRRGWTQVELAEKTRLTQTTISKIESGIVTNPSFDVVKRIAIAFDFEPGIFVIDQEVA